VRGVAVAVIVLVVLGAGVAGVSLVWPTGGGTQIVYTLQFPSGYTGDREAAARAAAKVLSKRLAALEVPLSYLTPTRDGRVLIRVRDVEPERIWELRSALERRGTFEIVAGADAMEILDAQITMAGKGECLLSVTLSPDSAPRFERSPSCVLFFDGQPAAQPLHGGSDERSVSFRIDMNESDARDWGAALFSGPLPYPIGTPRIERYRGRTFRP
jgi:hypothetical protein